MTSVAGCVSRRNGAVRMSNRSEVLCLAGGTFDTRLHLPNRTGAKLRLVSETDHSESRERNAFLVRHLSQRPARYPKVFQHKRWITCPVSPSFAPCSSAPVPPAAIRQKIVIDVLRSAHVDLILLCLALLPPRANRDSKVVIATASCLWRSA